MFLNFYVSNFFYVPVVTHVSHHINSNYVTAANIPDPYVSKMLSISLALQEGRHVSLGQWMSMELGQPQREC